MRLRDHPPAILANEDGGHPHRPLPATRIREAPAPLSPRDIAQDVNVDVVCHHLNVVVADRGHGIDDLLARSPLTGVRPDVDSIRTLRKHGTKPPRAARALRIQHLIERSADPLQHPSPRHGRHRLSSAAIEECGGHWATGRRERDRSGVSTRTLRRRRRAVRGSGRWSKWKFHLPIGKGRLDLVVMVEA